jgi:hypothetical protein
MKMPHRLDVKWMKSEYKSCFNVIIVYTWFHIMSFVTKILCDLSKATKKICSHIYHLQLKSSQNLVINIQIPCSGSPLSPLHCMPLTCCLMFSLIVPIMNPSLFLITLLTFSHCGLSQTKMSPKPKFV